MKQHLKYALGVLLGLLGLGLFVGFLFSRNKNLGMAAIRAIETAHEAKVEPLHDKIVKLSNDLDKNRSAVIRAEEKVRKDRRNLHEIYEAVGLSAEERAERYRRLSV